VEWQGQPLVWPGEAMMMMAEEPVRPDEMMMAVELAWPSVMQ
jgi:hypothetical protein